MSRRSHQLRSLLCGFQIHGITLRVSTYTMSTPLREHSLPLLLAETVKPCGARAVTIFRTDVSTPCCVVLYKFSDANTGNGNCFTKYCMPDNTIVAYSRVFNHDDLQLVRYGYTTTDIIATPSGPSECSSAQFTLGYVDASFTGRTCPCGDYTMSSETQNGPAFCTF